MSDDEYRWNDLATYNAERARGIVHTTEWQKRMAKEKELFDAESVVWIENREARSKLGTEVGWRALFDRLANQRRSA